VEKYGHIPEAFLIHFLHADRIKTPTLFLCGGNDFNVPLLNSERCIKPCAASLFPTELVIYPGQFHSPQENELPHRPLQALS